MQWFTQRRSEAAHPLAKAGLFSGLNYRQLRTLQSFMHERQYVPGEIIFDEGEDGQALYSVVKGEVSIRRQGASGEPIARLGTGEFFGELGLLDAWPRSAQAVASQHTELAVLFRGDFERLMEAHAQIASRIAMQLARHLGQRLRIMVASTTQSVEAR
jgi:CRP-like cAMP-binding protein